MEKGEHGTQVIKMKQQLKDMLISPPRPQYLTFHEAPTNTFPFPLHLPTIQYGLYFIDLSCLLSIYPSRKYANSMRDSDFLSIDLLLSPQCMTPDRYTSTPSLRKTLSIFDI